MSIDKVKKLIKLAIAEQEDIAFSQGIDITSDEWKEAILLLKKKILEKFGYTLNDLKKKPISYKDITDKPDMLTEEDVENIAKELIPEMPKIPAPKIINKTQVIKEIVKEKPITKVVNNTIRKEVDLSEIKLDIQKLQEDFLDIVVNKKPQEIKLPEKINYEELGKTLIGNKDFHYLVRQYGQVNVARGGGGEIQAHGHDSIYLKLDQTTQQTTLGTLTFPYFQPSTGYNAVDGTAGSTATTGGLTFKNGLYVSGSAASVSFGTSTQIPYMNATNDDFIYSANLVFSGTKLSITGDLLVSNFIKYLDADTGGTSHIFIGTNAGFSNVSAQKCVALGHGSLYYNQTGNYNIAIGFEALRGGNSGTFAYNNNVGIGYQTLHRIISTGSYNVAIGDQAGYNITTGLSNMFIGRQAGFQGTTAQHNLCIGDYAGLNLGTGQYNVFLGSYAGRHSDPNLSARYNIGIGGLSLFNIGNNCFGNIAIGYQAGNSITTGDYNIVIGYDVDPDSATANYQINIGNILKGNWTSGSEWLGLIVDKPFYFGAGSDATITYDGTNLLINPKVVGSGYVNIQGQLLMDDKIMFTQTDGNEYIDSLADGELDLGATTSINFLIGGVEQVQVFDGKVAPTTDNDIDLGDSTHEYKDVYYQGREYQNQISQTYSGSKALTDEVATGFVDIAVGSGEMIGGTVEYVIYVSGGDSDLQSHVGAVGFVAVNKGGTVTSDCDETYVPASEIEIVTAGTLTDAFTCTDGAGKITLNCNANTSLADPTITLKYKITLYSMNTITPL